MTFHRRHWLASTCVALASRAMEAAAAPPMAPATDGRTLPSMGVHGMVLFGGLEGLFASHMPMFHRPHDVQLVMRIRFADDAVEHRVRQALDVRPALWTLVPERFELDRLTPQATQPLHRFLVDWVDGHFERGGSTRESGLRVGVEDVLLHQRLSARVRRSGALNYQRIGAAGGASQFWVKRLDARPDADHIVAVQGAAASGPALLRWPRQDRLSVPPEVFAQRLRASTQTLYLETSDLA